MVLLHLGRIGTAAHRKLAVNSGHYQVLNAQNSNALSTVPKGQNWGLIISDRPAVEPDRCPSTSHGDGQVQADASAGPARPAPASSGRLRRGQTMSRWWTPPVTTPTPAVLAVWLPGAPPRCATSPGWDTADAGTPGYRTPGRSHQTPDTGHRSPGRSHRTPDTGHRTPDTGRPHRTLDTLAWTVHAWTLDAHTGHWTRTRGRWPRTRTGRQGTAGIRTCWATTPSGRLLDAGPCCCGRRLRRSAAQDGSAVRPPASAQDAYRSTGQLLGRSVGQAAPRRTALLGRLRVERRANGEAPSVMAGGRNGCV
jgi:hypothetical protein